MIEIRKSGLIIYLLLISPAPFAMASGADDDQPTSSDTFYEAARSPRTSEERRQEGVRHDITPWLSASTLVDLEWRRDRFHIRDGGNDSNREHTATFQLGLVATPWENIQGELSLEYDTAAKRLRTDEAFVVFEKEDLELSAGKLYTPFGQYLSHFPSGPLLEFGETRTHGIDLSYSPGELFDLSLTVYRGQARAAGSHSSRMDWAVAGTATIDDSYIFGLSYQSDLADANSSLLADNGHRYRRKVAAASGFFVLMAEDFELSFEVLGALASFRELESDRDQPLAWNLEYVHFINSELEWALRAEGSRELEDEPERQLGTALTWHFNRDISCSVEYLHGHFKNGLATNQADESYRNVDRVGVQISVGF